MGSEGRERREGERPHVVPVAGDPRRDASAELRSASNPAGDVRQCDRKDVHDPHLYQAEFGAYFDTYCPGNYGGVRELADEATRLRAEVERLEAVADSSASLAESLAERLRSAWDRAEAAEAALTRVRALADEWSAQRGAASWPQHAARQVLAALDPASPASRPSPASADDEGTGTGAASSEGHSEAHDVLTAVKRRESHEDRH